MTTQQAAWPVQWLEAEMKIDSNIAANPAYEAVKCDQEDHVVSEWVVSRQKRGNWHLIIILLLRWLC